MPGVFGISLSEIALIAVVALVVVGPQKLPGMLRTLGQWMGKLRRLTTEVRAQTGIDDILRNEGIDGGLTELRGILRGDLRAAGRMVSEPQNDPYRDSIEADPFREYPLEGADAQGALPDDLVDDDEAEDAPWHGDAAETDAAEPGTTPSASAGEADAGKAPPAATGDAAGGDSTADEGAPSARDVT